LYNSTVLYLYFVHKEAMKKNCLIFSFLDLFHKLYYYPIVFLKIKNKNPVRVKSYQEPQKRN